MVKGALLDPYKDTFPPLEVSNGTRFGSKHHIMAQLVTIYREGNTYQASLTHFWTFGAPWDQVSGAMYEQIKPF